MTGKPKDDFRTYQRGKAKEVSRLECSICGVEIYMCKECGEYLHPDEDVLCGDDGNHYCPECVKTVKHVTKTTTTK